MYVVKYRMEFVEIMCNILKNLSMGNEFKEMVFRFNKDDLKIHAMNNAKCMQFVSVFNLEDVCETKNFSKIDGELVYSLDISFLSKILNKMKGTEVESAYKEGKLLFQNRKGKFLLPVLEVSEEDAELKTPNLIFNTEFSVNPAQFFSTIGFGKVIGSGKEHGTFKFITEEGKLKLKTASDQIQSSYEQVFDEEEVIFSEGKSVDAIGRYALNYLEITYLPLDNVEMMYNTDYPLKVQYYFGEGSNMYFIIAPRVDND